MTSQRFEADTLTYTDGVANVTLKFGGEAPVNGAFADAASEKIFEDKSKGMIA